ncbi:MAG: hypothetical protein ACFFBD_24135 [Candidatus Hodarchaeota archaeon]
MKNKHIIDLVLIFFLVLATTSFFQPIISVETPKKIQLMPPTRRDPTPGTPYDATNGTTFKLEANNLYTIRTNEGYEFDVKLQNAVNMTITEFTNHPLVGQMLEKHNVIATVMVIDMDKPSWEAGIDVATLSRTFSSAELSHLANGDLSRVWFMSFDEGAQAWESPDGRDSWTDGNTVYANTTSLDRAWTVIEYQDNGGENAELELFPILFGLIIVGVLLYRKKRLPRN